MKTLFMHFVCAMLLFFPLMLVSPGCSQELTDKEKLARIYEMYEEYKKSFPDTPDISVEKLLAMKENGDVVLVDRREGKEQKVSMIPGAIPSEEFERDIEQYKDKTIVVYCTIGSRSGKYARRLNKKGMRAYNLKGSILAWIHAGQGLVSEGNETRRVHVYGRKWNLAPEGYEAVW